MLSIQQSAQLLQSGKLKEAVAALVQRIEFSARDVEAHQLLGVCYILTADLKLAEKHLLKAIKLQPGHVDALYNLARLYTEKEQYLKAKTALVSVLKQRPGWLQARFAFGLVAIGLGDKALAKTSFEKVVLSQPENQEAWYNLGNIEYDKEHYIDAKICYQKAVAINSSYDDAIFALWRTLKHLGEVQESIDLLEGKYSAAASVEYDVNLATSYRQLGNKEKSRENALAAIRKDPKSGPAFKAYYDSIKVKSTDDLDLLHNALSQKDLSETSQRDMHFAMGKGLESCGEFNKAIDHLDMANNLRRSSFKYSTQESIKFFEMLKRAYSKDNLEQMLGQVTSPSNNIFILGMPRSGTSLVEQIIASHSDVYGAGELSALRGSWRKEKAASESKFHLQLNKKNANYWAALGDQYMESVNQLKHGQTWLTDKMPHNFLLLGFIAVTLPNAKIVHCKRHPMANCLSIYKANFSGSHNYAYNQQELAEYHNLYEGLMDHWRQVLPGRFYEIKYEELTSNQEEETRKLLEYCELPWEDACLDFHKNKRAVKTASAYQVRQSMHTKSVDLWKRYGDGLKPLIDNLYIPEEYQD